VLRLKWLLVVCAISWITLAPLVMVLGLNPLFVGPLVEGRNDVMVLSWLIFTWALLQRGRITASAITLALACGTKHPAVVFVPF
jgi:hypothetical protein